jgi:hypothetical protein
MKRVRRLIDFTNKNASFLAFDLLFANRKNLPLLHHGWPSSSGLKKIHPTIKLIMPINWQKFILIQTLLLAIFIFVVDVAKPRRGQQQQQQGNSGKTSSILQVCCIF